MMNLFARALGGIAGDWAGSRWGLIGRTRLLGATIFLEGLLLVLFSRLTILAPATVAFLLFGLCVCMACGVTFAVAPLIRLRALGSVSGIVGFPADANGTSRSLISSCVMLFRPQRFPTFMICVGEEISDRTSSDTKASCKTTSANANVRTALTGSRSGAPGPAPTK